MSNSQLLNTAVLVALLLVVTYLVLIIIIALFRRVLWMFSGIFFLVDELMWFLYNPLRGAMKNREQGINRFGFVLFSLFLVKPVWQLSIWALTTIDGGHLDHRKILRQSGFT